MEDQQGARMPGVGTSWGCIHPATLASAKLTSASTVLRSVMRVSWADLPRSLAIAAQSASLLLLISAKTCFSCV